MFGVKPSAASAVAPPASTPAASWASEVERIGLRQPKTARMSAARAARRPARAGSASTGAGARPSHARSATRTSRQPRRFRGGQVDHDPRRRAWAKAAGDGLGDILGRDHLHHAVGIERWDEAWKRGQPAQQGAAPVGRRGEHEGGSQDHPVEVGGREQGFRLAFGRREARLASAKAGGGNVDDAAHARGRAGLRQRSDRLRHGRRRGRRADCPAARRRNSPPHRRRPTDAPIGPPRPFGAGRPSPRTHRAPAVRPPRYRGRRPRSGIPRGASGP